MTGRFLPLLIAVPALALAGCSESEPEQIDTTAPDPLESQLANAAPVELPPAIERSVTFRCKDNSLAYVDFFDGGERVNYRPSTDESAIRLTAESDGAPFTGEGYTITGDASQITLETPEGGTQTCTA